MLSTCVGEALDPPLRPSPRTPPAVSAENNSLGKKGAIAYSFDESFDEYMRSALPRAIKCQEAQTPTREGTYSCFA